MEELIQAHYLAGVGMVQWVPFLAALAAISGFAAAAAIWAHHSVSSDGSFLIVGCVFIALAIGLAAWALNNSIEGNLRQQAPAIYAEQAIQKADGARMKAVWP